MNGSIRIRNLRRLSILLAVTGAMCLFVLAGDALACPNCKEAVSATGKNLARGYFWSILFMLSMPILILGGLGSYFYYEVCKARRAGRPAISPSAGNPSLGKLPNAPPTADSPQSFPSPG